MPEERGFLAREPGIEADALQETFQLGRIVKIEAGDA